MNFNLTSISILDIILILVLAGFVFYGLFFGLIRAVGTLVAVFVGAWLAGLYYLTVYGWVAQWFVGREGIGKVLAFIVCFTIVNRLIGLAFYLLQKSFNIIAIIPFLKSINRIAGLVFGFVEGALILGLLLFVAARELNLPWFASALKGSQLAPWLISLAKVVTPLLPALLQKMKSLI